jgi:hypothetical protein
MTSPAGFPRTASVLAVLIGGLVLSGWAFDIAVLKSLFSGAAMPADAALAFVLSGLSLWLLTVGDGNRSRRAAQWLAAGVVLLSLVTLAEYLLGRDLRVFRYCGR